MSDELKKLLEPLLKGLSIKVLNKNEIEFYGILRKRSELEIDARSSNHMRAFGARVILRLMDEHEERKPTPRKEEKPGSAIFDYKEPRAAQEEPLTGPHWNRAKSTVSSKGRSGTDNLDLCRIVIDLADEVRRLKEEK